jgi:glycosyltransferase involved in cell wall biosynthesis
MACDLPVAASGVSALPETGKDAAVYFNPEDAEDIASKAIRILRDEELRKNLKARGRERAGAFSWEKTAAETRDFYRSLLESR